MRVSLSKRVVYALMLLTAACGTNETTQPTPPTTVAAPPTPPIVVATSIGFVSSSPPRGGMIHAGLPAQHNGGVTTGLTMTFNAVSDVDRTVRFVLELAGPRNGVCLTNNAPGGVPAAPVIEMRAGVPVQVDVRELLLTSVCRYPSGVDMVTAKLAPLGSGSAAYHTAKLGARFTIVE